MSVTQRLRQGAAGSKFAADTRARSRDMFPPWFGLAGSAVLVGVLAVLAFSLSRPESVRTGIINIPSTPGQIAGSPQTTVGTDPVVDRPETTMPVATTAPPVDNTLVVLPRLDGGTVSVPVAAMHAAEREIPADAIEVTLRVAVSGTTSILFDRTFVLDGVAQSDLVTVSLIDGTWR